MPNPILLNLPDHLETSRLHMRVPRAGDGAQVYAAVCESLPALRQFTASLPWVVGEQSEENSHRLRWFASTRLAYAENGYRFLVPQLA
ncbi:MAG: hypothetical protein HYZ45_02250 [Burkholderiales bacterium]|nr:hypothetical protein [Burkholderiales bacterium]